jgi:hypothetical protein
MVASTIGNSCEKPVDLLVISVTTVCCSLTAAYALQP